MIDPLRLIVAQPIWAPVAGPALAAGVLRYLGYGPGESTRSELGLIVKAMLSFAPGEDGALDGTARLIAPQAPCATRESALPGAAAREVAYPSDYVTGHEGVEVRIHGHAYTDPPAPRIDATLVVGSVRRAFTLVAGGPSAALPISAAYLQDVQSERPEQRPGTIAADAAIELVGLSPRAPRRVVRLPGLYPQAVAVTRMGERVPFELACDTLWIDTDAEEIALVFRGALPLRDPDAGGDFALVELWLEAQDAPEGDLTLKLQRGSFAYAREEREANQGRLPPPLPDDEASALRMGYWDASPEAALPLPRYAQISAELQEKREPRAETLRRHGLDEERWGLEERAAMEGLAAAAMRGDAAPAKVFGDLFLEAQEALAAPEEAARGVAEYAPPKAAMEAGADPTKVLAHYGMTLPVWMRLDRRMTRAAAADPALRDAIEAAAERAELPPQLFDDEAAFAEALARAEEDEEDDA